MYKKNKVELEIKGYTVLDDFYSHDEINLILECIKDYKSIGNSLLKTKDVFAIRQLLKSIPELSHFIFNSKLKELIFSLYKSDYFLTKAIYFDKPTKSNWFVPYHQDLSISVNKKADLENYVNWTFKKNQYGVQPPIEILNDTITIRIHLDYTNENNGALKVIPKSHLNGIIRTNSEQWNIKNEKVIEMKRGGIMLMKPLILHASNKTTNHKKRRVIHLEFNNHQLQKPLDWLEKYRIII